MNLAESWINGTFTMLVGTPGTRKSTQALSWPTPQYWLSWDQKMQSLLLPMRHWGIDPKLIEYDDYNDYNHARLKLESLMVKCPYRTIVADSLTTAANAVLRQTLALKTGSTRSSGRQAGKFVAGIPVNEIEDYAAESSALLELVSLLKDLQRVHRVNVVLIAHLIQAEYRGANQQANTVRTIVTAGKRIAPMIPAYCEEVYHHFVRRSFDVNAGGDYSILTSSTSDDFARTQLELPPEIILRDTPLYPTYIQPAIERLNTSTKGTTHADRQHQ